MSNTDLERQIPLLCTTNCFEFSENGVAGVYNPRLDVLAIRPEILEGYLHPSLVEHECTGHRAFVTQCTIFRVQRNFAGVIYALISTLIGLLHSVGGVEGEGLEDLRIVGPPDSRHTAAEIKNLEGSFYQFAAQIMQYHEALTAIHATIEPTVEVIATVWAVRQAYRSLPNNRASVVEERLLADLAAFLRRRFPDAEQYLQVCSSFLTIQSPAVLWRVAADALDFWDSEDFLHLLGRNPSFSRVTRLQNELVEARLDQLFGRHAGEGSFLDRMIIRARKRREQFKTWLQIRSDRFYEITSLPQVPLCRVPYDAMVAFDRLLLDTTPGLCCGLQDKHVDYMRAMQSELTSLKYIVSPSGTEVICGPHLVDSLNAHGLSRKEGYLWLLLLETLYGSLISKEKAVCPLAPALLSQCAAAGPSCPIRETLDFLSQRSNLVCKDFCSLQAPPP